MAYDTTFVKKFENTINGVYQQSQSVLRPAVTIKPLTNGEALFVNQVAKFDKPALKTGRGESSVWQDPSYSRRMIVPYGYYSEFFFDTEEELRMAADPKSATQIGIVNSCNRLIDYTILSALAGTAYTGKAGGTSTSLPSAQQIAVGSAYITLAKILSARKILNQNSVPTQDRFLVYNGLQDSKMLAITEVASNDYNTNRVLSNGSVDSYCGFKILMTEEIQTSTDNLCFAFHKDAICLAIQRDIKIEIDKAVNLKGNPWKLSASLIFGASRLQEEGVVQINCLNS